MGIVEAMTTLREDRRLGPSFVTWRTEPPRPARTQPWPGALDPRIVGAFDRRGIAAPYTHQAQAIEAALAGRDLVVVTPTASGKTLCYTAPVLQAIAEDRAARALYLFPTKALAQDQWQELHEIVSESGLDVKAFTYDGDTSPEARRTVRTAGHVVITNPDMLHTGILPHHTKWVRLFENLRYIVIDELHTYRGVFGSNVANVLRRLLRICRFYGSEPRFICCSATIANPAELASMLTGREVALIDDDGSPRGERTVALLNPPIVNAELGLRQGVVNASTAVAARLQEAGVQSIVFAGSRTRVEEMTQYLRTARGGRLPDPRADDLVRGYRSGYLPRERRAIEAGLRDGRIRTVVATNALELGIDIGGLDAAVIAGYPGTMASLRQQMGRAGRQHRPSLAVLVASSSPLDQYLASHPDLLFSDSVEAGLVDPDNPIVAAEHLKCAVFELPLEAGEEALFGAHGAAVLEALAETAMVHAAQGRVYWSSEAYPAEEVSLRQGAEQNVVIIEQGPPARVIGEVDRASAMTLVHDEAIYVHDGRQYHVDLLDWEELKAYVRPVEVDYYTDGHLSVDLKVIDEWEATESPLVRGHGEVAVTYLATLFKKIRLRTHENIGWGKIRLPQDDLHTGAFWFALPDAITAAWPTSQVEGALHGLGQLLVQIAPLLLMCDRRDLHLSTQVKSPHTGRPTVFLWESVPGGVGFGAHLFRETARLIDLARGLVDGCSCGDGCPGCVGPPVAPGLGVKSLVMTALTTTAEAMPGLAVSEGGSTASAPVAVDAAG